MATIVSQTGARCGIVHGLPQHLNHASSPLPSISVTHKNNEIRRCSQDTSQQVFLHVFLFFFFLHSFLHFFNACLLSSQSFTLHLLVSVRPAHVSPGGGGEGEGGGGKGLGGGGDGGDGGALHESQVFSHFCFF